MLLHRPLVSFDLECTGFDFEEHRIVEIAAIKLMPDGTRIEKVARINPEMPIPPESTAVHGIKDEDVADSPTFKRIAKSLWNFLDGCDYTGYNITKFDVPFLTAEFKRCGIVWPAPDAKVVDAYTLVVRQEPRDLSWAYKSFCGEELGEDAHSALPDAQAALAVLLAQADKYLEDTSDQGSLEELDLLQRDPDWVDSQGKFKTTPDGVVITFGKHKDKLLSKLPADYLSWVIKKEFPDDTKDVVRGELKRRRTERQLRATA